MGSLEPSMSLVYFLDNLFHVGLESRLLKFQCVQVPYVPGQLRVFGFENVFSGPQILDALSYLYDNLAIVAALDPSRALLAVFDASFAKRVLIWVSMSTVLDIQVSGLYLRHPLSLTTCQAGPCMRSKRVVFGMNRCARPPTRMMIRR